jgi:WD40 repeat protein
VAVDAGTVKVWEVASGRLVRSLSDFSQGVCFGSGGRIACGAGRAVRVWDWATGKERQTLRGHEHRVSVVAISPDGGRLVAGGGDFFKPGELKVWDLRTGKVALDLRGHAQPVFGVAFSPDGRRLASCGGDGLNPDRPGELKVWDAEGGAEVLSLTGHNALVVAVAFIPDGRRLAAVDDFHRVTLWDAGSAEENGRPGSP